jgi:hypothetical protein
MLEKSDECVTKEIGHPGGDGLCRCNTGRHGTRHSRRELGLPWEGRPVRLNRCTVEYGFCKIRSASMTFELSLISLSKARYAASSLGNMVELEESCFFHSNNLSLFDRLVSLHKASLVNLCRQKPQPRGSGCRVCGWLVGPILLSRSKRDRVWSAC